MMPLTMMSAQSVAPVKKTGQRYVVRSMTSADFGLLQVLESEIWGSVGEKELCPHYLRLCVEQFGDICFIALDGNRPVGYVLNIIRGRSAHCGTLAIATSYRRSRVTYLLMTAMIEKLATLDVEECWFTVSPDNIAARDVHMSLGARVIEERADYYGPGDTRLLSKITSEQIHTLKNRFSGRAA